LLVPADQAGAGLAFYLGGFRRFFEVEAFDLDTAF
jgi:hypothetical protein